MLATADLVKGTTIGIDATTLEANAALRSIVRRDSGETYQEFLTRLAQASGIETPTRADLARLDRTRPKKGRNTDWPAPELPTSTPDGTRVAFGTPLAWKLADGTGDVETLSDDPQRLPLAFSPDGTTLVTEEAGGDWGLGMLTLDGDRTPTVLLDEEWNENGATLSPDGRWMAYTSDETRRPEVYVRPFPDVDVGKWQISTDGGDWPLWNPAGDELFYRGPDGMMALEFAADPTFTPVGHALGFYHVGDRTAMMTATGWTGRASFTDHELYHAQLAYEVGRGKSYRGWPFALWGGGPEPPLPPVFVVD